MLRNYVLIASRNLLNSKFYSLFNILGLSIGIACCLILGLLVLMFLDFDKYHTQANNIYRIVHLEVQDNKERKGATSQGVLSPELKKNFAEVQEASRVAFLRSSVTAKGRDNFEESILSVDPSFFSIFSVPVIKQINKTEILPEGGILISQSASTKLFGKGNVLGETVAVKDVGEFTITGIFKDFPFQSHLQGSYIMSFSWIEKTQPLANSWSSNLYYNYVLLPPNHDIEAFNQKLNGFVHQHIPESWKSYNYYLQPLLEVHRDDSYFGNPFTFIGKTLVTAFSSVGIIILILACFNYMNMATARSARRAVEVGIRKVMGAYRWQLISQFMAESVILCTLSFLLAILWADLALPFFNAFMGPEQQLRMGKFFDNYQLITILVAANILIATIAGSYPAFFLSKFVPVLVLKGKQIKDTSRKLRRSLVALQFTLTGILVLMAIVVFRQADYMRSKDLGFNKENLALFAALRQEKTSLEAFKTELLKIPGVQQVTSCSTLPGRKIETTSLRPFGESAEKNMKIGWLATDHDYIPTLQLKLLAGRNFSENGTDNRAVILNEQAVNLLGWTVEEAIGKRIAGFTFQDSLPGEVIGVIKDFHLSSLRREIVPLVIGYSVTQNRYLARLEGKNLPHVRNEMEATINKLIPENTFRSGSLTTISSKCTRQRKRSGSCSRFLQCWLS